MRTERNRAERMIRALSLVVCAIGCGLVWHAAMISAATLAAGCIH